MSLDSHERAAVEHGQLETLRQRRLTLAKGVEQHLQFDQCAASIAGSRWTRRSAHPELSLAEQLLRVARGDDGADGRPGLESIDVQALVNLAGQARSVERAAIVKRIRKIEAELSAIDGQRGNREEQIRRGKQLLDEVADLHAILEEELTGTS